MQNTASLKLGLALLVLIAIGVVIAVVLTGPDTAPGAGGSLLVDETAPGSTAAQPGKGPSPGPDLITSGRAPDAEAPASGAGGGVRPGMRPPPDGIDLSDPQQRMDRLTELLTAKDIDWTAVGRILALVTQPLPEQLRGILLDELRNGRRRTQTFHAFSVLNDPSFVPDLFAILDDPTAARGAHAAALQALWRMPGANHDDVALQLESRLSGELGADRELLGAIAMRGGLEATRALVQYVVRSKQPGTIPQYILQQLDFEKHPDARQILVDALREPQSDATLEALVGMAGRAKGDAFSESLIGLDTDQHTPALRAQVFASLAKIGDERSVEYLLGKAEEAGTFGEMAIGALTNMRSANAAACDKLTKALETGGLNARPEMFKAALLRTLGRLRHAGAAPAMIEYLKDPSETVQRAAVVGLGGLGGEARPHVQQVAAKWAGADAPMRIDMAVALGSIGGEESLDVLHAWDKELAQEKNTNASLERTIKMAIRALEDAAERMANITAVEPPRDGR